MGSVGRLRAGVAVLTIIALLAIPLLAAAAGLSAAERRGKRIYTEGKGRKPITAFLTGLKAPALAFPCINCHLGEGAGTREGGVQSGESAPASLRMRRIFWAIVSICDFNSACPPAPYLPR